MRLTVILCALLAAGPAQADALDLLPLRYIERKMIYPLSRSEVDPVALGLPRAASHVLDRGGRRLVVWTLKAQDAQAPTVLYFHGNAGNLAARAGRFAALASEGFNVIAMSYPGSSGSSGKPSEALILSDAQALYGTAQRLIPGAEPENLILYGESLGSAVAIALMAQLAPPQRPAGVILEAPFTSIPAMARTVTDVPDNLIARIRDTWNNAARAGALTTPLLVVHGSADEVTPQSMGREIFSLAPADDKDFISVAGAGHYDTWRAATRSRLWRFIRTYAAR